MSPNGLVIISEHELWLPEHIEPWCLTSSELEMGEDIDKSKISLQQTRDVLAQRLGDITRYGDLRRIYEAMLFALETHGLIDVTHGELAGLLDDKWQNVTKLPPESIVAGAYLPEFDETYLLPDPKLILSQEIRKLYTDGEIGPLLQTYAHERRHKRVTQAYAAMHPEWNRHKQPLPVDQAFNEAYAHYFTFKGIHPREIAQAIFDAPHHEVYYQFSQEELIERLSVIEQLDALGYSSGQIAHIVARTTDPWGEGGKAFVENTFISGRIQRINDVRNQEELEPLSEIELIRLNRIRATRDRLMMAQVATDSASTEIEKIQKPSAA